MCARGALVQLAARYAEQTIGPTWLCPQCADTYSVRQPGAVLDGDQGLERYWSEVEWAPVCALCFEDAYAN